jgi:ABC-type uncharacterized transport system auxiliary subunit
MKSTTTAGWNSLGGCAKAFVLPTVALLVAGCNLLPEPQPDRTRHFTLSAPTAAAPGGVDVRPVLLAGHLRNRALAVRIAENEVAYLDDARWAEPLDAGLTEVLRAELAGVAGEWTVRVEIERFEPLAHQGNAVQLAAVCELRAKGDAAPRRVNFTSSPRTWGGRDHGELVGLLRAAAVELGGHLAAAMK